MIWMMPDALLAQQLRVSGALASRPLKEDPRHAGIDNSITAPRGMGAPLRPHARERHDDLPPSCWHLGGGWRRGRRGPSLPTPLARDSARLAHGARLPCRRSPLGGRRPRPHFRERPAHGAGPSRQLRDLGRLLDQDGARRPVDRQRVRAATRSEEHTSELQSLAYLVCRLLLEKKKIKMTNMYIKL